MGRWASKSREIGPESERALKVEIYPEEGNILPSRKEISLWMQGIGTAREWERGESPAPSLDVAETTWVCGLDFDFSVSSWKIVIVSQNTLAGAKHDLAADTFSLRVEVPSEKKRAVKSLPF